MTIGRNIFYLLIFLSIIWPPYIVMVFGPIGINPTRLVLFLLLFIWIITFFLSANLQRNIGIICKQNKILILLIVLFFLQGIISAILGSENKSISLNAAIIQILYFPVFLLFTVSYLTSIRHITIFAAVIFISLLIAEVVALIEFIIDASFFAQYVDPASKTAENILEGKTRGNRYRVTSTFTNPLAFAEFMVFVFPICLYVFLQVKKKLYRFLALSQLILIPVCIWFTSSRAGLGLLCLSFIWVMWLQAGRIIRFQRYALALLIILLSLILGAILGLDKFFLDILIGAGGNEASSYARFLQLQFGIPAVFASPLYGYGIHQGPELLPYLNAIDNYYLTVALEKGVTGFILLLFLQKRMIALLKKAYFFDYRHGARQSIYQYLIISFVMIFIFELVVSLTDIFSMMYILLGITMVWIKFMNLQEKRKYEF